MTFNLHRISRLYQLDHFVKRQNAGPVGPSHHRVIGGLAQTSKYRGVRPPERGLGSGCLGVDLLMF
jgi:hypothetical protein